MALVATVRYRDTYLHIKCEDGQIEVSMGSYPAVDPIEFEIGSREAHELWLVLTQVERKDHD